MSASFVYHRKGRGPFHDGTSTSSRYEERKLAVLSIFDDAQKGNTTAKRQIEREVRAALGLRTKDIGPADVQGVPILTNLSVQYAPGDLMGLELMPPAPVEQRSGDFFFYPQRELLQKAKTGGRTSDRGTANERYATRTKLTYGTDLDTFTGTIGLDTILNQEMPLNELLDLVEDVNWFLAMNRERRIVEALTTSTNYSATNRQTLLAGQRWDESGSEIVKNIQTGLAALWRGKGTSELVAWCCTEVWHMIQRSPALLSLLGLGDRGLVTPAIFVEYFGLDGLVVSDVREDTANIGAAASFSRLWGNFFGILRVSRTPQLRNAAFGYTFRWTGNGGAQVPGGFPGGIYSRMWYSEKTGGIGSYYYKRSHYERQVITAPDTGFLWITPSSQSF